MTAKELLDEKLGYECQPEFTVEYDLKYGEVIELMEAYAREREIQFALDITYGLHRMIRKKGRCQKFTITL